MAFEALQDRWEHMAPRERVLMALLGATAVVCVFAFVGMTITRGLDRIDEGNDAARAALVSLAGHREVMAQQADTPAGPAIPAEAPSLSTYLDEIAGEVGVTVPSFQPQPTAQHGAYNQISMNIDLRDITIDELAEFMEKVETKNRTVVITNLRVEGSFRDKEKLRKASMTVTTWEKPAAKTPAGDGEESGT